MKFTDYQNLTGDQSESVFWDKGKWDNYVLPHIKEDVKDLTYVDMGCNAGLFLKFAKDIGFKRAVGVDINPKAIDKGRDYKARVGGKYDLRVGDMTEVIHHMPVADYMSFINSHYYVLVKDWLNLVDVLKRKARYVIITATRKKEYWCMASAYKNNIRRYFRGWEEVGHVSQLPREGDPRPRSLASYCFKNPLLDRVPLSKLERGNHIQGNFHEEVEEGVHPLDTRYFKLLKKKKGHKLSKEELEKIMYDKAEMYWDVKRNDIKEPIIVNHHNRVLDGNHRKKALEYLGYETSIVRKVI